jgi:hypothetical protein
MFFSGYKRFSILALALAFVLGAAAPKVLAQGATTGSISGVVTDPQGGVIPGAIVKIISVDTGIERDTVSNDAGLFTMPRLASGKYTVRVSKQGFRLQEYREVIVRVAEDTALTARLELGSVTETVVVEATPPLVEANTAQTSNTFDQKKIGELPAVGNGLDAVALLAPGVIRGFGNVNSNGVTLSVNGQRSRSNNFTIDGQDNNDNTIGGPGLFLSIIDVVKEFTIITNNFSAEYGRNQGAIVNIVTKGGTNVVHGSLHASHQNSRLNANTFDNNRDGIVKPRFNDNRDAGAIGGPFKKDKAFFFFYLQSDQSKSISTNTSGVRARVITPAGLATIIGKCGATNTLVAYRDHGPFAQSIGNPTILPGSLGTGTYTPLASGDPCGGSSFDFETSRITRNTPTPTNQYDWGMKYDFYLTPKNTVNFRYLFQDGVTKNANGSSAGYEIDIPFRSQNLGVTYTRQLSSRQVNEVRFNYGRLAVAFEGANTFKFDDIQKNIARIAMPAGFLSFGLATNLPQNRFVRTWQWADNWTMQVGRHALKAGADLRRQLTPTGFLPTVNGAFTFSSSSPVVPGPSSSRGISNFIRNAPLQFNGAAGDKVLNIKETDLFLYFQDDFKIRPNFTLNLGIRYEYTGQPLNVVHDLTVARESNASTAFFNTALPLPLSARTVPELAAPKKNFAPRFGFAYTPRWGQWLFGQDKTVIRGGFSIAYDPAFFNLLLNVSTAAPTVFLYVLSGPRVAMPADVTGANLNTLFAPPVGTQDPRRLNQTQFDPSFRSPYAENWTFGIQRQLKPTLAFEVRYAGSRGVRLYQSRNGNPLVSGFLAPCAGQTTGSCFASFVPSGITPGAVSGRVDDTFRVVRVRGNTAASTYHSLQSRLDGRLLNQLTLGVSYTYSHNIDNVSEVFGFVTGTPRSGVGSIAIAQNPFDINKGERGSSNIDLTHALAANFIWDIPAFKSQHGVAGHVIGGWVLSGVYRWYTGRPMTPICFSCGNPVTDTLFNNTFFTGPDATRPFLSNLNAPPGSTGLFTSASSSSLVLMNPDFTQGAATTPDKVQFIINDKNAATIFGTPFGVGRNTFRGPRFSQGNAALYKNIKISERYSAQIRAEAENVFNTPFLGSPDLFIDDGTATFFNSAANAVLVTPRTVTVGLLFRF